MKKATPKSDALSLCSCRLVFVSAAEGDDVLVNEGIAFDERRGELLHERPILAEHRLRLFVAAGKHRVALDEDAVVLHLGRERTMSETKLFKPSLLFARADGSLGNRD